VLKGARNIVLEFLEGFDVMDKYHTRRALTAQAGPSFERYFPVFASQRAGLLGFPEVFSCSGRCSMSHYVVEISEGDKRNSLHSAL